LLNLVGITVGLIAGADGTVARNAPFRILVAQDSADGCVLDVGTARGDGRDTAIRIDGPVALSRALDVLLRGGATVEVGPWEHRDLRGRRRPITPGG
jgi:hypothetical protein